MSEKVESISPDHSGGRDTENTMDEFRKELTGLVNKHGLDNACGTPDFILAIFLTNILASLEVAMKSREDWFGQPTIRPDTVAVPGPPKE